MKFILYIILISDVYNGEIVTPSSVGSFDTKAICESNGKQIVNNLPKGFYLIKAAYYCLPVGEGL